MSQPAEGAVPGWLADEMAGVPEIAAFAGVDELATRAGRLAAAHPDVLTSRVVGHSAGKEPLTCLTVDGGPTARAEALVFGLPHPNEPAGALTGLHLVERLAADPALRRMLGLNWHVVPVIDPDGLRLNEGWLRGPFTREHYTRWFYRQAFDEQIDWSFPLGSESPTYPDPERPPETSTLMHLIDRHRPVLMASLHNGEYGGVYYYLSRNDRRLITALQQVPAELGMSLYRGVPESGWAHDLSDGVYRSLDIRDSITYDRAAGRSHPAGIGNSSTAYAARHGTLSVVTEVPYWRDPRTSDPTPTDLPLATALAAGGRRLGELGDALSTTLTALNGLLRTDSPFLRAGRHFAYAATADARDHARRAAELPPGRMATIAERASIEDSVHLFRLRNSGLLLRALDEEIAKGGTHPRLQEAHGDVAERRVGWSAEAARGAAEAGVVRNPIDAMVAVQYGAILAAAGRLVDRL